MKNPLAIVAFFALVSGGVVSLTESPAQTKSGGSPPASASKPSFSGGSKPSAPAPSPPASKPAPPPAHAAPPVGPSKPAFSGGSSGGTKPPSTGTVSGTRPVGGTHDTAAGKQLEKQESRQAMQKAEAPKPEYKVGAKTVPIDPRDKKVEQLRTELNHEKWANRDLRQQQFYGNYYSRPLIVYQDPYSSFFWYYLLDRSIEDRAMWAYNHRDSMDAARYHDLVSRDAQLESRIRQLEAEKRNRDPNYTIANMDPDLQYSDEFVDAAYNPVGRKPSRQPDSVDDNGASGWACPLTVFGFFFVVFVLWFVFVKEWN